MGNKTVETMMRVDELELDIIITPSSNNTQYTCTVSNEAGFMVSEPITLDVGGKLSIIVGNLDIFFFLFAR